ncbi:lytic transglycosylase domain-containing protein [Shewanella colwelliana]|uniref:lytic murein transglycosylase n=1 Tax=Shewanella colwelliana TaxID=23 RepID=UPI0022AF3ED7|nr:lytic murein transglycosylase [Shewanella colwelliana]MCZ4336908.1 lytic murein transglycosylase [Shewanella colwelliana]
MFLRIVILTSLIVSTSLTTIRAQERQSFDGYLNELKAQALQEGVAQATIDQLFPKIKLFKKAVVNQDEVSSPQTLEQYLPKAVSESLVANARQLYAGHKTQFDKLGKQYGVQPRFVIAFWGIVSQLGADVGDYPILSVTASHAYRDDDVASNLSQFFEALALIESRGLKYHDLLSTWSGRMGFAHFTVSEFAKHAIDGNGDSVIDIWTNLDDAFASTATLLKKAGWNDQATWGRQVQVPADIDNSLIGIETKRTFAQWQESGVTRFDGSALPNVPSMQVSLIMPEGISSRKYLVYDNYRALLSYNPSDYFALSVTYLSERIKYPAIK